MDVADIKRLLPHRYPMLLVDRVDEVVAGQYLVATKTVSANEPWYAALPEGARDHAYPPVLLVESWCQAAGLLVVQDRPNPDVLRGQVTLFGAIGDLEFHAPVQPGDVLRHQVRALKIMSSAAVLHGETLVEGQTVMDVGQVLIALRPAKDLKS